MQPPLRQKLSDRAVPNSVTVGPESSAAAAVFAIIMGCTMPGADTQDGGHAGGVVKKSVPTVPLTYSKN